VRDDAWYGLAVNALARYGILQGDPDGSFRPDRPITRAELAAVVSRFDQLAADAKNPYTDLAADHWAYDFIRSATAKGWFVGSDGAFRPNDPITRAELVTVVNRILFRHVLPEDIREVHQFGDLSAAHWAYAAFIEAVYTHDYERGPDGVHERWTAVTDDGIHAPYNQ